MPVICVEIFVAFALGMIEKNRNKNRNTKMQYRKGQ